jgi:beta-N-acetylhexosaminidase
MAVSAALSGSLLGACTPDSSDTPDGDASPAASATESVETTPGTAPVEQPVSCVGEIDPADSEAVRRAAAATLAVGVTGFDDAAAAVDAGVRHLFIGSTTDQSILNGQGDPARSLAALQERAGGDLTVSVDEEGGQVQRLADLTGSLPSAREMTATMAPEEVAELFTDHAHKLRDLGITLDFAPDVDLDGGEAVSDNAIGDRAFSDDPAVVVEYGRAVIDGLLAGGVTPVIKHFPGHGHATGDSHLGTVTTPPIDQMGPDLQPFAELAQVPGVAVMVGHMQVPGFDVGDGDVLGAETPASLNPASYGLLRNGVNDAPGFDGVIYTDDLTGMQAITDHFSPGDAVTNALRVGADAPLVSSGMDADSVAGVLDAVVAAVADGALDLGVVTAAADRICSSVQATDVPEPVNS